LLIGEISILRRSGGTSSPPTPTVVVSGDLVAVRSSTSGLRHHSLVIPGRERKRANPESITRSTAEYGFRARPFGPSRNDEVNVAHTQAHTSRVSKSMRGSIHV